MSDLVTLICPSCGGKLQVSPNTSVLNCQHCGTEHIVRREAGGVSLESFARCPQCGRNDRVEKVSAILRSHSQEVTTTEKRTETYYDQNGNPQTRVIEVPVTRTQVTGLARSFVPPGDEPMPLPKPKLLPKPVIKTPNSIKKHLLVKGSLLVIFAIFLLVATIDGLILTNNEDIHFIPLLASIFTLVLIVVAVSRFGIIFLIQGIKKKPLGQSEMEIFDKEKEKKLQDWQNENEQIMHMWQDDNRLLQESWLKATGNWINLYYCHRDDCVFVQGDDSYAPIEEMERYLYKDLPKPDVSLYNRSA